MSILKIILIALAAIYLVIGLGLYLFQERLIFQIEKLPKDFKYTFKLPFEEHFLKMKDGAEINVLHFTQNDSKGLVIYFHGNAGSLERWGEMVTPLYEKGYDVLIMDYRGYGKSKGMLSPRKMLSDSEAIYKFGLSLTEEENIILYGRSLGSAFASHLAGKKKPKMVILETPFYSLRDVVKHVAPMYPSKWLLKYRFNNLRSLKRATCPIHIFHGTDDLVVPYKSAKKLYDSLDSEQTQFTVIESGGHNNLGDYELFTSSINALLRSE
ncbi:MAG: alpha/beta hydrolase [Ekhidna sp.]